MQVTKTICNILQTLLLAAILYLLAFPTPQSTTLNFSGKVTLTPDKVVK